MAAPICSCGNNSFEVAVDKVLFSKCKARLVICSKCGLVQGVTDNVDIAKLLKEQTALIVNSLKKPKKD
jgi:uncharacterized Zn finger protein